MKIDVPERMLLEVFEGMWSSWFDRDEWLTTMLDLKTVKEQYGDHIVYKRGDETIAWHWRKENLGDDDVGRLFHMVLAERPEKLEELLKNKFPPIEP